MAHTKSGATRGTGKGGNNFMAAQDTVYLLQECDAGTKMAVKSLDDVIDRVESPRLKSLLVESRQQHTRIGSEIHSLLRNSGEEEKDPSPLAKGMSAVKTGWKMGMDDSDATVAGLITDGCSMGIKSLSQYLNEYSAADEHARGLCRTLISIEDQLVSDLRSYL